MLNVLPKLELVAIMMYFITLPKVRRPSSTASCGTIRSRSSMIMSAASLATSTAESTHHDHRDAPGARHRRGPALWLPRNGRIQLRQGGEPAKGPLESLRRLHRPVVHFSRYRTGKRGKARLLFQNNPTMRPSSSTSIASDEGVAGRPGMVRISPQIITTNSAPAANRTSRTLSTWPLGAPRSSGSVENEYCVLAMQIG